MNCPICCEGLDVQPIKGVDVGVCRRCDGLWLLAGGLDAVSGQPLEQRLRAWLSAPKECRHCGAALGFSNDDCLRCGAAPTVSCPRGHGTMDAGLVSIRGEEFEVDCCKTCFGIWLDGHERGHVQVPSASGAAATSDRASAFLLQVMSEPHARQSAGRHREPWLKETGLLNGGVGPLVGSDPAMWGKPERLGLIIMALFVLGLIAALHYFVAPMIL